MKCSWIAVPPFAFLMLVFSSCVSSSRFEEGKSCRVVRGEDNRTYTEVTWCDHGCCRDDQQREKCCDGSTLTSGMVFGFVITGSLVVLAFCIYVRLRVATSTAKPTRPSPAAENEAAPEVSIPEEDPPPPYWICMSQDPPQYDQAVSSFSTATASERRASSHFPSSASGLNIVSSEGVGCSVNTAMNSQETGQGDSARNIREGGQGDASRSPSRKRSAQQTELPQGVVLQPSALEMRPSSDSSALESRSHGRVTLPDLSTASGQEGTMAVFLPTGQLSADALISLLQSTDGSTKLVLCNMGTDTDDSSPSFSNLSGCISGLSGGASASVSTDVQQTVVMPSDEPSSGGSDHSVFIDESLVTEILKRISP